MYVCQSPSLRPLNREEDFYYHSGSTNRSRGMLHMSQFFIVAPLNTQNNYVVPYVRD